MIMPIDDDGEGGDDGDDGAYSHSDAFRVYSTILAAADSAECTVLVIVVW